MSPKARKGPRVLLVEDQTTFAQALSIALGVEHDIDVQIAPTGEAAVKVTAETTPDVVLMDLEMPGSGGLWAMRQIQAASPAVRVIVLSAHDQDLDRARALEAGAMGFLSKLTPVDEVAEAIRVVHEGGLLMKREEVARLRGQLRRRRYREETERQRAGRLTPRQTEILQLMAEGVPPRDIAERLSLSPATLRTHVYNILTRLGAHTKLEAVALAIRQGKISSRL